LKFQMQMVYLPILVNGFELKEIMQSEEEKKKTFRDASSNP